MQIFDPSLDHFQFIRALPLNIAVFDREMRYILCSDKWKETYRLGKERELTGQRHYDLFPDHPEAWKAAHLRGMAGETSSRKADPFPRENGTIEYNDWEVRPWYDGNGAIGGIVLITEDVTSQVEKRKLTEQLREERDLFSQGPVFTIVWAPEPQWPVTYISGNSTAILGYTPEEMCSPTFRFAEIIHPDDLEKVGREVASHMESGAATFEQSYRLKRKDGAYRWFYDFTMLLRDEEGRIVSIRGYMFDQSRSREMEAELVEHVPTWAPGSGTSRPAKPSLTKSGRRSSDTPWKSSPPSPSGPGTTTSTPTTWRPAGNGWKRCSAKSGTTTRPSAG